MMVSDCQCCGAVESRIAVQHHEFICGLVDMHRIELFLWKPGTSKWKSMMLT